MYMGASWRCAVFSLSAVLGVSIAQKVSSWYRSRMFYRIVTRRILKVTEKDVLTTCMCAHVRVTLFSLCLDCLPNVRFLFTLTGAWELHALVICVRTFTRGCRATEVAQTCIDAECTDG